MNPLKQFIRSKLTVQVIMTSLIVTIATAGIVLAVTTIGSDITTGGTLNVTGVTTMVNASSTLMSVGGAAGVFIADGSITDSTGAISFGSNNLTTTGASNFATASSTALATLDSLKVSSTGTTLAGIVFGTCSVDPQSIAVGASALVSTSCTASGVQSGDTVFVTPPADEVSTDDWLVFEGASASTTAGFIEITLFNASTTVAIDSAARTWSWMAIR